MALSHQRREEIARAKGFRSYSAYRRATPEQRAAATEALQQRGTAAGKPYRGRVANVRSAQRKADQQPKAARQRRISLGGDRELVRSRREAEVRAAMRRAESRGARVEQITVTIQTPDGPRTIVLNPKGGVDPAALAGVGDVLALLGQYGGGKYSSVLGGNIVDAADVLDLQVVTG